MAERRNNSLLKFVLEIGPLLAFFVVNLRGASWDLARFRPFDTMDPSIVPIMAATATFMVATVLALTVSLLVYRRVPIMPLVSGLIVIVFGGLTLYMENDVFIKMKPTIVNLIFAATLLGGLVFFRRPLLGIVLNSVLELDDEGWHKLSLRWGLFFLFLAVLNEIVWRNFSNDTWATFKVFGTLPLTVVFTLFQIPLMQRHALNPPAGGDEEAAEGRRP